MVTCSHGNRVCKGVFALSENERESDFCQIFFLIITDRIQGMGKAMFLQASVILFTGGLLPELLSWGISFLGEAVWSGGGFLVRLVGILSGGGRPPLRSP